ncbi:MAG TPA: L,D-transpeptidase family protein [Terriglobales bacterium]|nr:L,D-transpeptidase family protein [Terriglobales bacterium]
MTAPLVAMAMRVPVAKTTEDEAAGCLPDLKRFQSQALEFYTYLEGESAWVRDGEPTPQALQMIEVLNHADTKGLEPSDYGRDEWGADLQMFYETRQPSDWPVVRFDVALTACTMRYLSDLHGGRVNPKLIHAAIGPANSHLNLVPLLLQLIVAPDVDGEIQKVEPPFPAYGRTLAALNHYLQLAKLDRGGSLHFSGKVVRVGDPFPETTRLAERLRLFGDLRSDFTITESVYSRELSEGVKHFQQRHGLLAAGLLDQKTVNALNVPLRRRIEQLNLTLERWRWVLPSFSAPPIVVNIPEFRLHTDDENFHWLLSAKVVVGKAYRHQTPVFASQLRTIIFRPYWNVPSSIAVAELLPLVQHDSSYLKRHGFEVVDKRGALVAARLVDRASLSSGKVSIRQRPGGENALGLIKFEFPNRYGVYMHGTPETQLFIQSRRDFSHGCIRVENPELLAQWILSDNPKWTLNTILSAMNGQQSFRVNLQKPIPVLIVYGTAVVMEDGEVHFLDDIYKQDLKLEKALQSTRDIH